MLDEFGSENKDDYIGGFPPHPHRGIETVTYMLEVVNLSMKIVLALKVEWVIRRCSMDENWWRNNSL